jgi:hypothetical protein
MDGISPEIQSSFTAFTFREKKSISEVNLQPSSLRKEDNMRFTNISSKEKTMNYHRQPARLVLLAVLTLATVVSIVKLSRASIGNVTKADLAGSWQATLVGSSGCGTGSLIVNFTLNNSGAGSATFTSHSSGCGDTSGTFPIAITSLKPNGSGTAGLSCGASCGWVFQIQVSPDRSTFNMVDSTDPIPNFWAGSAVHQ